MLSRGRPPRTASAATTQKSKPELRAALRSTFVRQVFDVTRAPQYYAPPDGGYAFFSGRDGTRAFITGEFNETGAHPQQLGSQ